MALCRAITARATSALRSTTELVATATAWRDQRAPRWCAGVKLTGPLPFGASLPTAGTEVLAAAAAPPWLEAGAPTPETRARTRNGTAQHTPAGDTGSSRPPPPALTVRKHQAIAHCLCGVRCAASPRHAAPTDWLECVYKWQRIQFSVFKF
jgi:hypothetical protein